MNKYLEKIASYGGSDDPEASRKTGGIVVGLSGLGIGAGPLSLQQIAAHREHATNARNNAIGATPYSILNLQEKDIPRLQQAHADAVEAAANGPTWRKAQRFLDHDVSVAKAKLDDAVAKKSALEADLAKTLSSDHFKKLQQHLDKVNSKKYAAKTMAWNAARLGLPAFVIGSGVGMVTDAWRGDFNDRNS